MDGQAMLEIERPRSATELIGKAFDLYRRYPLLFLLFAAAVVVPYELIVLAVTGTGPVTARSLTFLESTILSVVSLALVTPLVSALHVHAVDDVSRGERPALGSVARRSLRTLPVVAAATVMSALGIAVGFVALIVPGILLLLRWSVVAQAAALEDGGWRDALSRSTELARDNWEHIFGVLFLAGLVGAIPGIAVAVAFRHTGTTVVSFLVGTAWTVLVRSFTALVSALLYFDLRSRFDVAGAPGQTAVHATGHPLDPNNYSDTERPHGWYVDPRQPKEMAYWSGQDRLGWTPRRARTPRKTLADWNAYEEAHLGASPTPAESSGRPAVESTGHPLDPDGYSDAERPPGWYVIPDKPWRMRHWSGEADGGWSNRTAKTPKSTQDGWYKARDH